MNLAKESKFQGLIKPNDKSFLATENLNLDNPRKIIEKTFGEKEVILNVNQFLRSPLKYHTF
jgi:hypothetical protein